MVMLEGGVKEVSFLFGVRSNLFASNTDKPFCSASNQRFVGLPYTDTPDTSVGGVTRGVLEKKMGLLLTLYLPNILSGC